MSTKQECVFDVRMTNLCKGIAILAMVFHHTCANRSSVLPLSALDFNGVLGIVAASGKVCVALLTMLSGYGLSKGYEKKGDVGCADAIRFSFSHYLKFCSIYFPVYLLVSLSKLSGGSALYPPSSDSGMGVILNVICEILCLRGLLHTPTMMGDWFVGAIVIFYFLFPIVFHCVKKFGAWLFPVAYLPWIGYVVCGGESGMLGWRTDQFSFYLFPFVMGIWLAQRGVLDRLCRFDGGKTYGLFACVLCACMFVLRAFVRFPADPFWALSIVGLSIFVLAHVKCLRDPLVVLGKHSANIWLLHMFVWGIVLKFFDGSKPVKFCLIVFCCFVLSSLLERIKQFSNYNYAVDLVREKLK